MKGAVSAKVSKWEQTWYEWRQKHPLERRKLVRHLVTSEDKDQFGGNDSCETQASHPATEIDSSEFPAVVTAEMARLISPFSMTPFSTGNKLYLAALSNTTSGGKLGSNVRVMTNLTVKNDLWFSHSVFPYFRENMDPRELPADPRNCGTLSIGERLLPFNILFQWRLAAN